MMRFIIKQSLRFRFVVVAIAATMMLFGIGALRKMPVDVFPEFAPPRVQIQTACLGLTASEVEQLVTNPMEQAFYGIDGLDIVRSKSAPQLSALELIFKLGTDEMHARQLVQERLATIQNTLPTWAAPPVILQPLSATSRVLKIGITSDKVSLEDLSMQAYWTIRARLLRIPGVANIPMWGERIKAYQVEVDPGKLESAKVPLDTVMEVTSNALDAGLLKFSEGGFIGTGGFIDTPNQRLGIRHKLPIVTAEDLAQVPVAERDGKTLRIGDVAQVVQAAPALAGDAIINNGPGLLLVVEKLPWGNTLDITRNVEKAIKDMQPGLPDVKIDTTIFRPAGFVQLAIDHLTESIILGAPARAAGARPVPLRLAIRADQRHHHAALARGRGARALRRGATVNTMVLAGLVIALGAIVDDAIVDVENIVRRLRLARLEGSTQSTAAIILDASIEVRGAVVYASFIEVITLIPIFFLTASRDRSSSRSPRPMRSRSWCRCWWP